VATLLEQLTNEHFHTEKLSELAWDNHLRHSKFVGLREDKTAKILARPERHEMESGVEEQLIVEFYSR